MCQRSGLYVAHNSATANSASGGENLDSALDAGRSGEAPIARHERAVQGLGQPDIRGVVRSDVGAQFVRPDHQRACRKADDGERPEILDCRTKAPCSSDHRRAIACEARTPFPRQRDRASKRHLPQRFGLEATRPAAPSSPTALDNTDASMTINDPCVRCRDHSRQRRSPLGLRDVGRLGREPRPLLASMQAWPVQRPGTAATIGRQHRLGVGGSRALRQEHLGQERSACLHSAINRDQMQPAETDPRPADPRPAVRRPDSEAGSPSAMAVAPVVLPTTRAVAAVTDSSAATLRSLLGRFGVNTVGPPCLCRMPLHPTSETMV